MSTVAVYLIVDIEARSFFIIFQCKVDAARIVHFWILTMLSWFLYHQYIVVLNSLLLKQRYHYLVSRFLNIILQYSKLSKRFHYNYSMLKKFCVSVNSSFSSFCCVDELMSLLIFIISLSFCWFINIDWLLINFSNCFLLISLCVTFSSDITEAVWNLLIVDNHSIFRRFVIASTNISIFSSLFLKVVSGFNLIIDDVIVARIKWSINLTSVTTFILFFSAHFLRQFMSNALCFSLHASHL